MPLVLLIMHVRHVASHLFKHAALLKSFLSHLSPFCSHFFWGNTRSFSKLSPSPPLGSTLRRKIPSFPHKVSIIFSILMILALLLLKSQKLETKKWSYRSQRKTFIITILLRIIISSMKYLLVDFSRSAKCPSTEIS